MLRDSSGPWIFESNPHAPVIIKSDYGNKSESSPMKGMDPPVPTYKGLLLKIF